MRNFQYGFVKLVLAIFSLIMLSYVGLYFYFKTPSISNEIVNEGIALQTESNPSVESKELDTTHATQTASSSVSKASINIPSTSHKSQSVENNYTNNEFSFGFNHPSTWKVGEDFETTDLLRIMVDTREGSATHRFIDILVKEQNFEYMVEKFTNIKLLPEGKNIDTVVITDIQGTNITGKKILLKNKAITNTSFNIPEENYYTGEKFVTTKYIYLFNLGNNKVLSYDISSTDLVEKQNEQGVFVPVTELYEREISHEMLLQIDAFIKTTTKI